ncbi:MAG: glycosyltransferase family 9 protein [Candidatus Omnitrophica bacterium]|nr:glycosyltransferase family 9 protein [Candidatus Omnitrophota bacterium]
MLRAERFDAAFILRKSLTRTLLVTLAGIPRRIGFEHPKSNWLLTHRVKAPAAPAHKAHVYLRLLEPPTEPGYPPAGGWATEVRGAAGEPPGPYEYFLSDDERTAAGAWLRERGWAEEAALIVLHPGANWPHKRWPPERFAELADRLAQRPGRAIALTGGPDDEPLIRRISGRMRVPPLVLAGQTTLRQLAACLERAGVVVSNDTGVLHIASALRRPVVALYGPTSPAFTGPLGAPERTVVIHHADCCPQIPCFNPDRPRHPGMDAISVDEAHEAAERLLAQGVG